MFFSCLKDHLEDWNGNAIIKRFMFLNIMFYIYGIKHFCIKFYKLELKIVFSKGSRRKIRFFF